MTAITHKTIPLPPPELVDGFEDRFVPSPELKAWCHDTFIAEGGPMSNVEHFHLLDANISFLWSNVENTKKGRHVIGTAEEGKPQGAMGKWARARALQQVTEWFGEIPDFIITIFAPWWDQASDIERCALLEHELFHCAQDKDKFGMPKFSKSTGRPSYTIVGHDCEEFIGVVKRYGIVSRDVRELVDAANDAPELTDFDVSRACGSCK